MAAMEVMRCPVFLVGMVVEAEIGGIHTANRCAADRQVALGVLRQPATKSQKKSN